MNKIMKPSAGIAIRCIHAAPGLIVFTVALCLPVLRREGGFFTSLAWTIAVCGLSLTLVSTTWRTRWQQMGCFLALALFGQACALQLLYCPPYGVYQRYFFYNQNFFNMSLSPLQGLCLLVLLVQTIVTVLSGRLIWSKVRSLLYQILSVKHIIIFLLCMIFVCALFSNKLLQYSLELVLTCWISVVNVLNFLLVVIAIPPETLKNVESWLKRKLSVEHENEPFPRSLVVFFPWLLAVWVTAMAAVINCGILDRVPHIPDSVAYLFQAKYFSAGHLYLPSPPDYESFLLDQSVFNDGAKWYGFGFPGWPAILAIGVLLKVPWLVNPILGGLTVILAYALVVRLYNRTMANMVVLLLALSPWFLLMSSSFMAHTLLLVLMLSALLAMEKAKTSGRGLWGCIVGVFLGALFLTRPFEGLLIGVFVGLRALGLGGPRLTSQAIAGLVVATLLVSGLLFGYNYKLTGDPMKTPFEKCMDARFSPGTDRLGFGPDVGRHDIWPHVDPLPGHGPVDIVINANMNFYKCNFELFGWSFGSLIFVVLFLLLGKLRKSDWYFLFIIIAIVVGQSFYWHSGGPDWGARYWYLILLSLVVLTVRGIQTLQQRLNYIDSSKLTGTRITAFILVATIVAFINVMPWRCITKYYRYRDMSGDMRRLSKKHNFGHSLVFVKSKASEKEDFAMAFLLNPPTLEGSGTIYALDTGFSHRKKVRQHFPDRPVYFVGRSPTENDPVRVLSYPVQTNSGKE